MNEAQKSFREFKSEWTLNYEHEDYFLDYARFGCHETAFEKWLKYQRLFIKRYAGGRVETELASIVMPQKMWFFFTEHYIKQKETQFIVDNYPAGFFEAISKDGREVVAFLPDTYGKKTYRLSFYNERGAIFHETYDTRKEALTYLARGGYSAKEGALDVLVGTDDWNRGVYVCKWIAEGLTTHEGLERDKHIPEVRYLFRDRLAEGA